MCILINIYSPVRCELRSTCAYNILGLIADASATTIGTAVGVSVFVTFVMPFMGVLVASVLCYISRRSKESLYKPSSCADPATVIEVGTNKKMKEDVLELNTNTAYGSPTVQEVGTNKEMAGDVVEMRANTSYVSIYY